jgi:hypothetical protein
MLMTRLVKAHSVVIATVLLATPLVHATSVFDFDVWMRGIDKLSVSVQQRINRRELDAARADALELERLYRLMEHYYIADGQAHDAVQVSRDGRELAAGVALAIERQDLVVAARDAREIALACNDCHDVYKPIR